MYYLAMLYQSVAITVLKTTIQIFFDFKRKTFIVYHWHSWISHSLEDIFLSISWLVKVTGPSGVQFRE